MKSPFPSGFCRFEDTFIYRGTLTFTSYTNVPSPYRNINWTLNNPELSTFFNLFFNHTTEVHRILHINHNNTKYFYCSYAL